MCCGITGCLTSGIIKWILGALNSLFFIFGISVIVVICITIFMQGKSVTDELSLNTVTSLVLVTGILAILGCVVFAPVLCFPACCTKCFILAYCGIMVVLVIIEIWAMESINTESGKLSSKADTFLITGMFKYDNIQLNEDEQNMDYEQFEKSENFWDKPRDNLTEENIWYRQVWDWAQEQLECCGVRKPGDWIKVRTDRPESCCKTMPCIDDDDTKGCSNKLKDYFDEVLNVIFYVIIGVAILQVAAFTLAVILCTC